MGGLCSRPEGPHETAANAAAQNTEIDDEERQKINQRQTKERRPGVAAEQIDEQQMKDFVAPVFEKTPEETERLDAMIKGNEKMQVLIGHLSKPALNELILAFEKKHAKKGEALIQQGAEGDAFYVVDDGEFEIFVARKGEDGTLGEPASVAKVGKGAFFGELALMYNAPRAATVKCITDSAVVWALGRDAFRMLLIRGAEERHKKYEGFLTEVPIFQSLNHYELGILADLLEEGRDLFDCDDVIIKQGDTPGEGEASDKFYILDDGTAEAKIKGEQGEVTVKKYENQGEFFGEVALLSDVPRKATVVATGTGCVVLSVSKKDFDEVLGPCRDFLKRNADAYPQYAEFVK